MFRPPFPKVVRNGKKFGRIHVVRYDFGLNDVLLAGFLR
jgi:hypothetical protein